MNLIRTIIIFKTHAGQGQALLSHFNILIYLGALTQLDNLKNDPTLAIIYFVIYGGLCFAVGLLYKLSGLWMAEQTYNTHDLNEWNRSLMYKVDALRIEIQELNDRCCLDRNKHHPDK